MPTPTHTSDASSTSPCSPCVASAVLHVPSHAPLASTPFIPAPTPRFASTYTPLDRASSAMRIPHCRSAPIQPHPTVLPRLALLRTWLSRQRPSLLTACAQLHEIRRPIPRAPSGQRKPAPGGKECSRETATTHVAEGVAPWMDQLKWWRTVCIGPCASALGVDGVAYKRSDSLARCPSGRVHACQRTSSARRINLYTAAYLDRRAAGAPSTWLDASPTERGQPRVARKWW